VNQRFSLLLFTFCFSLFTLSREFGIAQQYHFKNYSIEQGLAQAQVMSICQDRKGNLWFGTNGGGVSKFDGHNFENFTTEDGLVNNKVNFIFQDSKYNIWFCTDGGLSVIVAITEGKLLDAGNKFENFTTEEGLAGNTVWTMLEDDEGNLLFGTNEGLSKYDGLSFSNSKSGLSNNVVRAVLEDREGNLWIGTENGLTKYDGQSYIYFSVKDGLTSNQIFSILEDRVGNLWFGTAKGISKLIPKNSDAVVNDSREDYVFENFAEADGFVFGIVYSILEDSEGDIWFASLGGGVAEFSQNDKRFKRLTTQEGLSNNNVFSILEDHEGNLWFATLGGGVSKFSGKTFEIYTKKDGLRDNFIWAIVEDVNGNIWVGTETGGVSRLALPTAADKGITGGFQNFSIKKGLVNSGVYSISVDRSENLWFCTSEGLLKLAMPVPVFVRDGQNTPFLNFVNYSTNDGLVSNRVRTFFDDSKGNIWIGYFEGKVSKIRLNQTSGKIIVSPVNNEILNNYRVYSILEDKKGNIWFATAGGGVVKLPVNDSTENRRNFKNFTIDEGLANNDVRTILEDKKGNLWFGTGGGISKYNPNNLIGKRFESFTTKDGLSSDRVYSMIFDDDGNLWIGTNIGIDKFDLIEYNKTSDKYDIAESKYVKKGITRFRHYGYLEGFLGIETNSNAVCKDKYGNIWFGTIGGLIKYDPSEDRFYQKPPRTYITRLRLFMDEIEMIPGLELSYEQNQLSFDFIGISLTIPEKVRYQYKLEGLDYKWSSVSQQTSVSYNLPPGKYTFMVKASNGEEIWNKEPATYSFNITPPLWKTWWFYTLCVLTLIFLIYLLFKIRLRNLRIRAQILQEQVELKTTELRKEKEKVEEQNKIIARKNADITGSIRYAQRIQEAILPVKEKIGEILPESFIIFKPKDIVSGDFYWFAKKNGRVVVAAVDCTGHGVPGAFMSLIGSELLNDIVNNRGISDPAEILKAMHERVVTILKKDEQESDTVDGMDIALCSINLKTKVLEFAGAGRPLILISNGKIEMIKGDKFPVGLVIKEKRNYTTEKISMKDGDTMYMFTDGYCDQFGGAKSEKFMIDRFKKLLLDIQTQKMPGQEKILDDTIEEWIGNNVQLDDILVIGIRV